MKNLSNAQNDKKYEFYTQYEDIQNELNHYEDYFKNKTVFCNCDDPFAERLLNLRQFDERQKRIAYENQKGICPLCKKHFEIEEMEGDHIVPWSKGGETVQENCQMLCIDCNRHKSNK